MERLSLDYHLVLEMGRYYIKEMTSVGKVT